MHGTDYFPSGALLVWQAGIGAYENKDYKNAVNLFRLAEEGYRKGVLKNDVSAVNVEFIHSWYISTLKKLPDSFVQTPPLN